MKLKDITGFKIKSKIKKQFIYLISIFTLFLILLVTAITLSVSLLNNNLVYNGVHLDGIHLGGLEQTELRSYLKNKYSPDLSSTELTVYHKNYPVTISFEELNVHINPEAMFDSVFNPGRQGNFVQKLFEIYQIQKDHLFLDTAVSINQHAVDRLINEIYDKTYLPASPPSLIVLDDEVSIQSGSYGYRVNKEKLNDRITDAICKLESDIVIVPVDEIPPAKIDVDSFYNEIIQEPQDAVIKLVNGNLEMTPDITGRELDKAVFLSSVAEMEGRSGKFPVEVILPVSFIKPERTIEDIETSLFRDVLSTYTTHFPSVTENDKNRATNIRLAVEAINGSILLPGDTFSFNDTVGKRTTNRGYQPANIYSTEGIALGVGGGVCQVSSTLYNTILAANLEVTERNPHIYPVSYVPLGQDAAVSYGTEDFRFTNNSSWPIRIDGSVTPDNKIVLTLHGTNENPTLQVSIITSVLKTIPYNTELKEDTAITDQSRVKKQPGMDGAIVDTFFILRGPQGVISNYRLHTSTYNPLTEIIHVAPGNIP